MSENNPNTGVPSPPASPPMLDVRMILEKELGIAKVYDYISQDTFDLVFQGKLIETYEKELLDPLLGGATVPENTDGGRSFLREELEVLKIKETARTMVKSAEEICLKNGIKDSMTKRLRNATLIVMSTLMISYFVVAMIPELQSLSQYLMFIVMFGVCIIPQFLRTNFMKKWNLFKKEHKTELQEGRTDALQNLHVFVQEVLDDARDRLVANKIPLNMVSFVLFSKGFNNLQLIREQDMNGVVGNIYQFQYPEGVAPFPMPGQSPTLSKPLPDISEDDENDYFIILNKVQYDENGAIKEFDVAYGTPEQQKTIEHLLGESDFQNVDKPENVIPFFTKNDKIMCRCKEFVHFKDLIYYTFASEFNFEFYLAIGQKCGCGKNPFIIFPSPGNKEIPADLKDLFK